MSLIVKIGADTRSFEKEMRKMTKDIQTVSSKLGGIGKSLTKSVTLPILAIGAATIKLGSDFEASMSKLNAVTGATGTEFDELKSTAMDMGATTQYSAKEAADAMTELAKAGMDSAQTMSSIPGVLAMAASENMDLARAAEITSAALNSYGMEASEASRVADVLAMNSNKSASGVESLGAALAPVAGFASQLGIPFEELNASLGILSNNGVDGAIAGQKMMGIFRSLAAPASKAGKEMKKYGIEAFDANGKMKSLPEILDNINEKTAHLGDKQRMAALKTMFGTAALSALLPLLKEGGDAVADYSNELANSEGYATEMADAINDNLQGSFKLLASATETAAIALYENIGPALKQIVDWIAGLVSKFATMSPEMMKFVVVMAGIAAAVGPVLVVISKMILVIGKMKAAFTAAKTATTAWGVVTAIAGGPMILIAAGIIALIAVIVLLVVYWDKIKEVTIKIWGSIADFCSNIWKSISDIAVDVWGSIQEYFSGLWDSIKDLASSAWNGIKNGVVSVFNSIKDFFSQWGLTILAVIMGPIGILALLIFKNWDLVKETAVSIWNSITEFLVGVWQGIVAFVTPIFQAISDVISSVWNTVYSISSAIWTFIWEYLVAIWTAILYFVTPIFEAISKSIKEIWDKVQNITSKVWNSILSFLKTIWNGISTTTKTVWNAIFNFLKAIFQKVSSIVKTVWNSIKSIFTSVLNGIKSVFNTIWNGIKSTLTTIWNSIKSVASTVWNAVTRTIMGPVNKVKAQVTSAFNGLKSSVSSVFNSIKSIANSIWSSITTSIRSKITSLVSGVKSAFTGMKSAVVGIWNGLKTGMKTVINGIIKMVNVFIKGFNTPAKLLNKIPGVKAPTIPNIPLLATGGTIFGSGQAIVGEAGPELVSKSGSSVKVTPLSAGEKARGIGGALGDNSGGTIIVPVSLDGKIIAKVVAPHMDSELRGRRDSKNRAGGGW